MANREINKKAKKIANKILSEMTYDIAYEIESAYERIIDGFYKDYTPLYYERTYSTYLGSNVYNDISKGIQKTSSGYKIGISVSSDYIEGDPYLADKDYVFHRSFVEGIHGFTENDPWGKINMRIPPKTSPTPKEQMDQWFQEFKKDKNKMNKIKQNAIKRALK